MARPHLAQRWPDHHYRCRNLHRTRIRYRLVIRGGCVLGCLSTHRPPEPHSNLTGNFFRFDVLPNKYRRWSWKTEASTNFGLLPARVSGCAGAWRTWFCRDTWPDWHLAFFPPGAGRMLRTLARDVAAKVLVGNPFLFRRLAWSLSVNGGRESTAHMRRTHLMAVNKPVGDNARKGQAWRCHGLDQAQ
jgi:hypothetical protein